MKALFFAGLALLILPFLTVWFTPHFPRCEYGFVNPLFNLLPLGDSFVVIALCACGLGYASLLFWISRVYKTRTWYFKLLQYVLVTALALLMVSILLASLNTARSKPTNAFMKFYIASTRAYAEIYAENNLQNGYEGFCSSDDFLFEQNRISERISSSEYCYVPADIIRCVDAKEGYAISGKILSTDKKEHNKYWCVDSANVSVLKDMSVEGTSCTN